jgi:malate dehydrogenase (quinone)
VSEPVDVVLIGGGIMSATLGTLLKQLQPDWKIVVLERLSDVAEESSNAWNNAGTGHAALCELNYMPEAKDGSVDPAKAISINEQFQQSRSCGRARRRGILDAPSTFINATPHMTFVRGRRTSPTSRSATRRCARSRCSRASSTPRTPASSTSGRRCSCRSARSRRAVRGHARARRHRRRLRRAHAPAVLTSPTRASTSSPIARCESSARTPTAPGTCRTVTRSGARRGAVGALRVRRRGRLGDQAAAVLAHPEISGYGVFPIGGQWLKTSNPAVVAQHKAKVYSQAAVGAPPMSVPHLDTRVVDGETSLLFGPFATFSPKFLKNGRMVDIVAQVRPGNIGPMLKVAVDNRT